MANDLVVRFRGDEGNRKQFYDALERDPQRVAASVTAANEQLLRSRYGIRNLPNKEGYFVDVKAVRSEIDAVNGVIKQFGQLGYTLRQAVPGKPGQFSDKFFGLTDVQEIQGDANQLIQAAQKYVTATKLVDSANARSGRILPQIQEDYKNQLKALATPRLANARTALTNIRSQLDLVNEERLRQGVIAGNSRGIVRTRAEAEVVRLEKEALALEQAEVAAVKERNAARSAEARLIARDTELLRLRNAESSLVNTNARRAAAVTKAGAEQDAAIRAAVTAVPANYKALQQISPQLLKILEKGGLPKITDPNGPLRLQQQSFNAPRYDLTRDVTKFSGAFQRSNGIIADWSAEVDKSGKVVTRFGGQLSGASQVIKQITRDFQKVIEWTVATTIVFGSLQYAISQLNNLKELDFALQKFAITAQQSPEQARQSFARLAEIAHNTATPLLEIVGAADDIALATQKAGQSTEAWNHQIFSLTESVGIFTNLTGTDTVTATDLLTATMKQLRLTAEDIPAILSKITAVAGGQSQAISDITKGLSAMAEAGRIANLTVDQQIATVQVLSQVTSKTPAEVATAFKNLVGSLGSPAALKGLEKFNIAVRDQSGELRNILDVYGEISDKIRSGVIPTADVQGLVRAISGGPRRSPDAAALLANIDQIAAAQQKSANATNEAAIANAKAIDTTKAKLIQLQTAIDAATFEKFGGEFKNAISSITNLLTSLLTAFNKIPTGAISAAIQIGLFFIAIKVGTRVLSTLASFLGELAGGFLSAGEAALGSAKKIGVFNAVSGAGKSFVGSLGKNAGRIGAGALVGAGFSALSGGTGTQIAGGALQGVGLALLAFPDPTLLTKIAGGIALIGGTLLQFADSSKEAADEGEKAAQVLDSFTQYKSASQDISLLADSQGKLANQIDNLNRITNKTATDYQALESAQRDYADGVISTIDATTQATKAREDLIKTLSTGNDNEKALAAELRLAQGYDATSESLQKLALEYQKVLFLRVHPDLTFQESEALPPVPTPYRSPYEGQGSAVGALPTTQILNYTGGITQLESKLKDLKQLTNDPKLVKDLFSNDTLLGSFDPTKENLQLIENALLSLAATGDPAAAGLQKIFQEFTDGNDIIKRTTQALASYQSYIDFLTLFDPTKAAELQKVASLVNKIPEGDQDLRTKGATLLRNSITSGTVDYKGVKEIGEALYNSLNEGTKKHTPLVKFLTALYTSLGIELNKVGITGTAALEQVTAAAEDSAEALDKSLNSIVSGIASKFADAKNSLLSGDITQGQYDKQTAGLQKYLDLVQTIGPLFHDALADTPHFFQSLQQIQGVFANVAGLEDAASLSAEDFVTRLLTLGETYGLNGKQLGELSDKLKTFYDDVIALEKLHVDIPISLTLDLKSVNAAIAALKAALKGAQYVEPTNPIFKQLQALELLKKILSDKTAIQKQYDTGAGGGGSKTTKAGLNVSTLDLPDAIANATNRDALIQQAIANAKKLQSQIPGATKDAKNDLVVILDGLTKVMQVHGVKSEYLNKALDALTAVEQKRLDFESKADTIRRIRIGAGDFSAIANVPVNSATGVSTGPNAINITMGINGTVLTPAQLQQFANMVAAALKSKIANG